MNKTLSIIQTTFEYIITFIIGICTLMVGTAMFSGLFIIAVFKEYFEKFTNHGCQQR